MPPASEVSSVGYGAGWRYLYRRRACHTHGTFRTYAFQNLWGANGINIIIYGRYSRHDFYALCFTPARNAESVTKMELLRAIGSVLEHSAAHVFQLAPFDCWYQYGTGRSLATAISAVTAVELEIGFVVVNGARDSIRKCQLLNGQCI